MTRVERLQQDIQFAQNRLALKNEYLPQVALNTATGVTPPEMLERYMDGIQHEEELITEWTAKLEKLQAA